MESLSLATAYVDFVARGVNTVFTAIDQTKQKVQDVHQTATKAAGAATPGAAPGFPAGPGAAPETASMIDRVTAALTVMNDGARKVTESLATLGTVGKLAFAGITAGVTAWVTAGLQGTAQAQMLAFEMGELSRGIAAIFLPVVERVTDAITRVADWFHKLSEAQQNSIIGWVAGAAGAAGILAILPKLASMFGVVTGAVKTLATAITAGELATGIGAILPVLGLVAAALGGLAIGTEAGRSALSTLGDAAQSVFSAIKPAIEAVGNVFSALFATVGPIVKAIAVVVGEWARQFGAVVAQLLEQVKPLLDDLALFFADAGAGVADALISMLQASLPIMTAFMGVIRDAVSALKPVFAELRVAFEAVREAITSTMSEMLDVLRPLMTQFGELFVGLIPVIKPVIAVLVGILKGALEGFVALLAAVKVIKDALKHGDFLGPAEFIKRTQAEIDAFRQKAEAHRHGAKAGEAGGRRVEMAPGAFISPEQLFKNIQQAASGGGKSHDEQIEENTKDAADRLEEIRDSLRKPKDAAAEHSPPPAEN